MKKHIIISLSLISSLNGMEKQITPERDDIKQQITPKREPREWDAKTYDEGNELQTKVFLQFLETYKIKTENKTILSVGCGTGKIEEILARKATHIHGFDASENMINFARNKYGHIKNLSFEHRFAEDFQSKKRYQLALSSACVHWIEDKKEAFQRINDSLEINGELFTVLPTSNNPKPTNLIVGIEMMPYIQQTIASATGKTLPDLTNKNTQAIIGSSYPSHEELNSMLRETGFEIIKSEEQPFDCIATEDEFTKFQWPIFSSRPFIKPLPNKLKQKLFKEFMTRYIAKLSKTENDKFLDKHFGTVVHARKVKKQIS